MTGIELAINKAEEYGWESPYLDTENGIGIGFIKLYAVTQKEFWVAFCLSLGWKENYTKDDPEWSNMTVEELKTRTPKALWQRFTDWLYEKRDPDEFFNSLLSK